ncbi:unnamed protein product, partial [Staurois parvus]
LILFTPAKCKCANSRRLGLDAERPHICVQLRKTYVLRARTLLIPSTHVRYSRQGPDLLLRLGPFPIMTLKPRHTSLLLKPLKGQEAPAP